jgi:hypothetical protein
MTHQIYRVVGFQFVDSFVLHVHFDDDSTRAIDFRPILAGAIYGPLQDERLFAQVSIDPEVHTLVWPNGADFDPETLHNWPQYAPELEQMAQRWQSATNLA